MGKNLARASLPVTSDECTAQNFVMIRQGKDKANGLISAG